MTSVAPPATNTASGRSPAVRPATTQIVAFDQEGAFALTELADVQRRRSFDERVLGAREGG